MSKTILLIENDAAFAREATDALEAAGFRVRVTGDGKEGLDLAREVSPAAIVLCVELPKMSGYSICQKLKKEEALRAIPLVLTSAEATAETFDQHRKLKARAEEYLIKPYSPATLLEKLGALIGLPEGAPTAAAAPATEEVVALEEEDLGLESLGREPEAELPALDLSTLPDEPMHGTVPGMRFSPAPSAATSNLSRSRARCCSRWK
jgi:DNA-binding response OmpR family regulator